MKTASPPLIAIVMLLTCILLADIQRATGASGPVSVHKRQGLYYEVSVDFKGVSHARVGELLAREIQREMPDYQVVADSLLRDRHCPVYGPAHGHAGIVGCLCARS